MENHEKVAKYFPDAYRGTVITLEKKEISVIEMADFMDMDPISQRFGLWAITKNGIECLNHEYVIQKDRLYEHGWIHHMSEKTWVNIEDFESVKDVYVFRTFWTHLVNN